jgi:SprT-like family
MPRFHAPLHYRHSDLRNRKIGSPLEATVVTPEQKAFNKSRIQTANEMIKKIDDKLTNGAIALLTQPTGGIKVFWSSRLRSTAGRAHTQRKTSREPGDIRYYASIELSAKVLDDNGTSPRLLRVRAFLMILC